MENPANKEVVDVRYARTQPKPKSRIIKEKIASGIGLLPFVLFGILAIGRIFFSENETWYRYIQNPVSWVFLALCVIGIIIFALGRDL